MSNNKTSSPNSANKSGSTPPKKSVPAKQLPLLVRILFGIFKWVAICCIAVVVSALSLGAIAYAISYTKLPDVSILTSYQPKLPLRIYSAEGILLGEYSEEPRQYVPIDQMPITMIQALLAVEDANFYNHPGVDFKGMARATLAQLTNPRSQGASTITMQVARNFFLTSQRTYIRKYYEVLASMQIENVLTKNQILEIYMNHIFLGQRSYGFAAAAQTYFGKKLGDLTLAESAMLAGLPQSPSTVNPFSNLSAAQERQRHVLNRMRVVGVITQAQYDEAIAEPLILRRPSPPELHAEYAADAAQQMILEQFGPYAYTSGFNVYTTILATDQKAAYSAVRQGLITYELRQRYRGPEGRIDLPQDTAALKKAILAAIDKYQDNEELLVAIVLSADPKKVVVTRDGTTHIEITSKEGLNPVNSGLAANARAEVKIVPGSVVRIVSQGENKWALTQLPLVEGALVALDPQTGAIRAMVGGFDFTQNKYNHVTQASRQPGSTFKPFVYSAALERGITANTILNDAPITVRNPGGAPWTPKNYGNSFAGRVPMYEALARSRNIPVILTLDAITPVYAQQWSARFGFDPAKQPASLSMALGAGSATPLQMAGAFATFANGGYRVDPYLIARITDSQGDIIFDYAAPPLTPERRVIPERNAFVMNTLLRQVVTSGSGGGAQRALRRSDIYGKTGTTNDSYDAWFAGFSPTITAVAWVGYDNPTNLGNYENGGKLALPIWTAYMKAALEGVPQKALRPVAGVTNVGGQWVYDEFARSGGIRILGDELTPSPENIAPIDAGERGNITDMFR